jgi:hypothetical protein
VCQLTCSLFLCEFLCVKYQKLAKKTNFQEYTPAAIDPPQPLLGTHMGLRRQELGNGIVMARAKLPKGGQSPSKARMLHPNWGDLTCPISDEAMTTPMEGQINAWVALNKC